MLIEPLVFEVTKHFILFHQLIDLIFQLIDL